MRILLLIIFIISSVFSTKQALAQVANSSPQQCLINSPRLTTPQLPTLDQLISDDQLVIISDHTEINYPGHLKYWGNIDFIQNNTFIHAQRAEINRQENSFTASGNLHFQDKIMTLNSDSLTGTLDGKNTELINTKYWFNGMSIHGQADSFKMADGKTLVLRNALFTTCPTDQPDWALRAKKITIDTENEWAIVRRATFELFDIPVFYFPYLTLPISDKRATGFLYPNIGTNSRNGADISVPFYWNIAPEYDLTLTPRIMTNRGFQLGAKFRYLVDQQQGLLNVEYLGSDKASNSEKRYLLYWQHQGKINKNWRISTDVIHASDDNYFNDIGSEFTNKTDNQLIKTAELGYYQDSWWLNLKIQDIKVLGAQENPYQLMPQLSFHSYQNQINPFVEYDLFSEFSYFANNKTVNNEALRLHVEPTLRVPLNYATGSLVTELSLLQTWYQQTEISTNTTKNISRTLPQFRINASINFERDATLFNQQYLQTFEPQFQYLYVAKKDQSEIKLYDTAKLRDDYHGLFRARRFSGLDRIADANQITLGITNRFRNSDNQETFKLSVGQTYYLTKNTTMLDGTVNEDGSVASSALAGEIDFQPLKHWYFSGAIQFEQSSHAISQAKTTIDYRLNSDKLIQFSHRYIDKINTTKIDQLGLQGVWPINQDWTFVGNYYRDINLHRTIESFIGLQYESCCWAITLQAYRQLNTIYENSTTQPTSAQAEFDNGFKFNFKIKGLGASSKLSAKEMLDDGLFSYRRPYYLKN